MESPGDWEAWTSQGPINIHQREYLGTTDEGVSLLRTKLKKDIRSVERGKEVFHPIGTEDAPFHTYGGDTVLRLPEDRLDDNQLMRRAQSEVARIYFEADRYEENDRRDYITHEIRKHFGDDALSGAGD